MNSARILIPAGLALMMIVSTASAAGSRPIAVPVAGWLERVRVSPGDIVLDAKLDTGASTSSVHAVNLRQFERDGKDWVAFDLASDDGRSVRIRRPIVRIARIQSAPGVQEARPTVTLGICIGSVYRITEVNLVDRGSLTKPLLIGRRFLRGRLAVDLRHRYLLQPACKSKAVP